MIRFDNIEVAFGDFVAIPNLSLEIPEGSFFTLLGPSGCGKTTALRTLAGLVTPTRGAIWIDGKDVTRLPPDKRQLGMVFQNYALFPTMSVWDNIAFGLKVARLSSEEISERVAAIAREVQLTDAQLHRNISEMSGGQQQRVAIARALVMRPKILMLDEPLSNLDARLRHQLRLQLKDMQRHFGITSVYVTHDQTEALSMSDGIAVMDAGTIQQAGTPREVYSRPSNEFVCTFIGDANALPVDSLIAAGMRTRATAAYVRVERVGICPAGDGLSGATPSPSGTRARPLGDGRGVLELHGRIADTRYEGIMTTYLVDVGHEQPVKVVVKEDGRTVLAVGDHCVLTVHEDDILLYGA
ncbi:ABC transporter ATP-binding protein [Actinomyces faecalis]|uniref:ABC transporter ATP-binding protein n=1 Tax=Actinomyces faecalis TaxID=2722820 RepID=UPI001554ACFD|nr:ABC transporter ATP-binding protein [Actinomyces faecalis]